MERFKSVRPLDFFMVNGYDKTLREVDRIVSRVNIHPEYSACISRSEHHNLRKESERHPLCIESLNEGRVLSQREKSYFLSRLDEAYEFLAREGISLYTLSKLGSVVEPRNPTRGFRREFIACGGFNAPDPGKVPYRVQHLIEFLEDPSFHPVLRATNAHLELVEIHPYQDGNSRSARLLQNFCLEERGYPSAIILTKDLNEYIGNIHNALRDRHNGVSSVYNPSTAEREFFDFVGQRVLSSAKILEGELRKRRMYEVELREVNDPGVTMAVAKCIRKSGKHLGSSGITVSVNRKNGNKKSSTFKITGDLGKDEVEDFMKVYSSRYKFKYNIRIDYC